jgi:hypothetical protein
MTAVGWRSTKRCRDSVSRFHKVVTCFFEGPTELLQEFVQLESLLTGEEAARVTKAIQDCVGNPNVVENLESLGLARSLLKLLTALNSKHSKTSRQRLLRSISLISPTSLSLCATRGRQAFLLSHPANIEDDLAALELQRSRGPTEEN